MDNLLLTQGWTNYNYSRSYDSITIKPEMNLSISGQITSRFFKERKKTGLRLNLFTFGDTQEFDVQNTDSLGRSHFNLKDTYGESIRFLIQSGEQSRRKKNFTVVIDREESPKIEIESIPTIDIIDSLSITVVKASKERKRIDQLFQLSDVNELDEVEIVAYKMTPLRKKVMEEFGRPTTVIRGEDILAKEEDWHYGVYSLLRGNFPNQIKITGKGDSLIAYVGTMSETTLVIVDGETVFDFDLPHVAFIPPNEVKSVEIIEYAGNFIDRFKDVYPEVNMMTIPAYGHIIAIYTHAGIGLKSTKKPKGLTKDVVDVFSPIKEFFAPKYKNKYSIDNDKPDLRSLVNWQPIVAIDENGIGELNFLQC